jgi:hypothetical protein
MKLADLFPSKYFKAADIQTQLLVTIGGLQMENMPGRSGQMETKPVLYFQGQDRSLVLNQVNANTLAELFGEETDDWAGQRVVLFSTRVPFGNQMTDGLRLKAAPSQQPPRNGQAAQLQHPRGRTEQHPQVELFPPPEEY